MKMNAKNVMAVKYYFRHLVSEKINYINVKNSIFIIAQWKKLLPNIADI